MSSEPPSLTGSGQPLEVLRRWDERAETRYALTGAPHELGALGVLYPATAVDSGGVVRDVRVLVLAGSEAERLRGRIHDNLVALGSLRNPNLGVVEATVELEQRYGLVLPHTDGAVVEDLLEGGAMPARAAAEVGLEVAWGLAAAHAAVLPDEIRPTAFPHGAVAASNIILSGLAEVVLADYNVHAARSAGATPADDIYALGLLIVNLVDGEPMPALPADPDAARRAVEEDLANLEGLSDELRALIGEMLDPVPSRRPDVRSVSRRLRRIIPQQDGLWLSAWAESTIGLPERVRPTFQMPTPTMVREELASDEVETTRFEHPTGSQRQVDETPPLVRAGRKGEAGVALRFSPGAMVLVALVAVLVLGGGFQLVRFWLDLDGPIDMADVPTDEAGADKVAAAGPASSGGPRDPDQQPDPSGASQVTIIQAEAGIEVEESDKPRPDRERVETDEAIDPNKSASAIDDGMGSTRDADAPGMEPEEMGPPPWPRPNGTLGELDLFVEVPLAEAVELRCVNGLSMTGPSAFRAAIMQSTPTTCVVSASLRGDRLARTSLDLDQSRDLICRSGFHESLRCTDRPTGRNVQAPLPTDAELADRAVDIRVRVPLAQTADLLCGDGARQSGINVEWLELDRVPVGMCSIEATMPDGPYLGQFPVTQNADVVCLRDFSGKADTKGRRTLRCAEATTL